MRHLIGVAIVLAFAGISTAQEKKDEPKKDEPKKEEAIDGKKLVGKWELADGKEGIFIELSSKGTLTFFVDVGSKTDLKLQGTYKLDGNKLEMVLTIEGKERRETVTITKLTDDELTGKDTAGKEDKFKRVKPKK